MKSGLGSETDLEVVMRVQGGYNPPAKDKAAHNMQYSTEYKHPKATGSKSCIWANKTGVVAPNKQTTEKVMGDGDPTSPRTGRALNLETDNKNSGPRGH